MNIVSHKPITVGAALRSGARRLIRAGVYFGHGTDNALDEAAALLWHAASLPYEVTAKVYERNLRPVHLVAYRTLIDRRISTREPAVYLTGLTFFAGLPMQADSRALVPRSPIAELIERKFEPWIDARKVKRILDLGTGGGCIALACAHYLPRVRVDGTDLSVQALALARVNSRNLELTRRVRLLKSDHFTALKGQTYDIIVSNPPYVGEREMKTLPAEYGHEPRMALAAGKDGMDSVHVLLRESAAHLKLNGILVVEVGNTEATVRRRYPRLPFAWLEFERGGSGVFLLTRAQLQQSILKSEIL